MTRREVLEQATFGKRVAEEEADILSHYFVRTEQWKRLHSGDVDIIYGPKGSGKSALYSLLTREFEKLLLERRIVGVPAENPRGAPAFRDLVDDPPASEEQFRQLWRFYFLTILAEYIRFQCKSWGTNDAGVEEIIGILVEAGLMRPEQSFNLKTTLKRALEFVRSRPVSLEGMVKPDFTGVPEITARVTFGEPTNEERKLGYISSDDAFLRFEDFLERKDVTVWLMLDRLDVAFTESPELEKRGLRALFRTYLDLLAHKRIGIKIFLRDDIWRRIAAEGFREASHITRSMTIVWNEQSLLNLIVRRALHNPEVCELYSVNSEEILSDAKKQSEFFYRMFPDQVAAGKRQTNTLDWMLTRVSDGSQNPAPRELIHLLQEARNKQLRAYELGGDEPPGEALVGRGALKDSLPEVSKVRFDQTLCAEYPALKNTWLRMEGGKSAQTIGSLARLLNVSEEKSVLLAEQMVEAGFFVKKVEKGETIYWVPFIYRDALKMVQGKAD
jgi:hypothetical protein